MLHVGTVREVRFYVARPMPDLPLMWLLGTSQCYDVRHKIYPIDKIEESERIMGVFDKAFAGLKAESGGSAFTDEDFRESYPVLHQFMTWTIDDKGAPRQTSTVMIFVEEGVCKACLKDRDHDCTLWKSSSSILGALEALERGLTETPVEWRKAYKAKYHK